MSERNALFPLASITSRPSSSRFAEMHLRRQPNSAFLTQAQTILTSMDSGLEPPGSSESLLLRESSHLAQHILAPLAWLCSASACKTMDDEAREKVEKVEKVDILGVVVG